MNKGKKTLNISIFGEKYIPKIELIETYIKEKKYGEKKPKNYGLSFVKIFKDKTSLKLHIYEHSEVPDKKVKDIATHHCAIIMFDMTNRTTFEDVLDKWIRFLREIKYNNSIILFGTRNPNPNEKDSLPMTDKEEINYLIEIANIKGEFYDISDKNDKEISDLIDNLIEQSYEESKSNMNKKDCIIF